jgi:hypothetical protein
MPSASSTPADELMVRFVTVGAAMILYLLKGVSLPATAPDDPAPAGPSTLVNPHLEDA